MLQIAVNSCVSPKREIKPKLNQQIGPTKWVLLDNLLFEKTKYFIFIKKKKKNILSTHSLLPTSPYCAAAAEGCPAAARDSASAIPCIASHRPPFVRAGVNPAPILAVRGIKSGFFWMEDSLIQRWRCKWSENVESCCTGLCC